MQAKDIKRLMENGFEHLLTIKEVTDRVSLSASTIYRLIREGKFPEAYKINQYMVRWKAGEINQWIQTLGEKNGES